MKNWLRGEEIKINQMFCNMINQTSMDEGFITGYTRFLFCKYHFFLKIVSKVVYCEEVIMGCCSCCVCVYVCALIRGSENQREQLRFTAVSRDNRTLKFPCTSM